MADLIAVTGAIPEDFRTLLLTFDRIAWPGLTMFIHDAANHHDMAALLADLQFLNDRRLLIHPGDLVPPSAAVEETLKLLKLLVRSPPPPSHKWHSSDSSLISDLIARAYAISIREHAHANAAALTEEWSGDADQLTTQAPRCPHRA
jgi:hypothetical protein